MISLPNSLVVSAYLSRGLRLWLAVRGLGSLLVFLGGFDPLRLSAQTLILLLSVTAALAFIDLRIRKEAALIGNLGISIPAVMLITVVPGILGEVIIGLLGRLL